MAENGSTEPTVDGEEPDQGENEGPPEHSGNVGQTEKSMSWDCPVLFPILGLAAAVIFAGWVGLCKGNVPATLTALALIPPYLFVWFERYVNRPSSDSGDDDSDNYHPNLRIWGYGIVLGAGLVVLYLLTRVVLFSIGDHDKAATSASTAVDSAFAEVTGTTSTVADSTIVNLMEHSASLMKRSAEVASLRVWQDGLLLFFLSAALAVVMYALVNVSRSEI